VIYGMQPLPGRLLVDRDGLAAGAPVSVMAGADRERVAAGANRPDEVDDEPVASVAGRDPDPGRVHEMGAE
jgi:hypothetical protein